MSAVRLEIGGRSYDLAVRDGQEAHFRTLASLLDARCRDALRTVGGLTEVRLLLYAALMLADDVEDARLAIDEAAALREAHAALTAEHDALAARHAALAAEADALRAAADDPAAAVAVERLAARVEAFADRLEKTVTSA